MMKGINTCQRATSYVVLLDLPLFTFPVFWHDVLAQVAKQISSTQGIHFSFESNQRINATQFMRFMRWMRIKARH